jgi:hypothetical protein
MLGMWCNMTRRYDQYISDCEKFERIASKHPDYGASYLYVRELANACEKLGKSELAMRKYRTWFQCGTYAGDGIEEEERYVRAVGFFCRHDRRDEILSLLEFAKTTHIDRRKLRGRFDQVSQSERDRQNAIAAATENVTYVRDAKEAIKRLDSAVDRLRNGKKYEFFPGLQDQRDLARALVCQALAKIVLGEDSIAIAIEADKLFATLDAD